MNGVHDLGGMHGFGPVIPEPNEPVFHHDWERRVFAMALSLMGAGIANVDEFRRSIERMPAAHYLDSSYYEHWFYAIESLLKEKAALSDKPAEASAGDDAALWANLNSSSEPSGAVKLRSDPRFKPRFKAGDRVTVRKLNPEGHTRVPRYTRGRRGVIYRDWGTFVFPDTHAHGLGANPQHCYAVEFSARELFGPERPARDRIYVDLWESYLEKDAARGSSMAQTRPQPNRGKQHERSTRSRPRSRRA